MSNKTKRIEETEVFIVEFEKQKCLWDVQLPTEYKNKNARQSAINMIGSKVSMNGEALSLFFCPVFYGAMRHLLLKKRK